MAYTKSEYRPNGDRPAVDEWGVYDPNQAGLPALFDRLDTRRKTPEPAAPSMAQSMEDANRLKDALANDVLRIQSKK
jgi:hypothetical protein